MLANIYSCIFWASCVNLAAVASVMETDSWYSESWPWVLLSSCSSLLLSGNQPFIPGIYNKPKHCMKTKGSNQLSFSMALRKKQKCQTYSLRMTARIKHSLYLIVCKQLKPSSFLYNMDKSLATIRCLVLFDKWSETSTGKNLDTEILPVVNKEYNCLELRNKLISIVQIIEDGNTAEMIW